MLNWLYLSGGSRYMSLEFGREVQFGEGGSGWYVVDMWDY